MSSPPVELTLLCAVAQNLNSTPNESDRRVEIRKKLCRELERRGGAVRILDRGRALLQSAIVLYLAPLCSPLRTRLLSI